MPINSSNRDSESKSLLVKNTSRLIELFRGVIRDDMVLELL